jgi:hypothetical protein
MCLSIRLCFYLFLRFSTNLSVCPFIHIIFCLSVPPAIYIHVCLLPHLSANLSACLSLFIKFLVDYHLRFLKAGSGLEETENRTYLSTNKCLRFILLTIVQAKRMKMMKIYTKTLTEAVFLVACHPSMNEL